MTIITTIVQKNYRRWR